MSMTTETIGAAPARQSAMASPRLQLKHPHRACGFVHGAWWPRSTILLAELPPLLAALSSRLGPIDRVCYHENDWSTTPQISTYLGGDVKLDANQVSPNVISVFGTQFGRLILLVVPPYTNPTDAYRAVTTAASADGASTPDQLLGISAHNATDCRDAGMALHQWKTEGGALRTATATTGLSD
jgi:hypothetical protein